MHRAYNPHSPPLPATWLWKFCGKAEGRAAPGCWAGALCRILDMDLREFFFLPSTWVNKDRQKLQLYKATACQRSLTSLIVPRVSEWLQMRNKLLHTQKNLLP